MLDAIRAKNKIVEIIKNRGPSLPIQLAKQLGMNSLFVSAFLSEMGGEKLIKISSLKVGGSPLYFLNGQESQLENFSQFLNSKEREAFELLKNNKVLKDSEQEPAIRVALRSIRDFAVGFKKDDEIYWRYMSATEGEVREILEPKKTKPIEKAVEKPIEIRAKQKTLKQKQTFEADFQNPLALETLKKNKKQKPKSEFVLKTIDFLAKNNLKILEEKEYKDKEYNCLLQVNSSLGAINFLTQAKDKKIISEADLKKFLSKAQKTPLPAFILYTGSLSKKAEDYAEKYFSILKTKKI